MVNQKNVIRITNRALWLVAFIVLSIFSSSGCSRPNPTPEILDPIYADLNQKTALSKAEAEKTKKELETAREDFSKLQPRDPSRKKALQDIKKKEDLLVQLEQQSLYYEIRAEKRREHARQEYSKAYEADKPWPNPDDFAAYKLSEKLRTAPRDWGTRVPKTDRYNRKGAEFDKKKLEESLKNAGPAAAPNH